MVVALIGDVAQKFAPLCKVLKDGGLDAVVNQPIPDGAVTVLSFAFEEGLTSGTIKALQAYAGKPLFLHVILQNEVPENVDPIRLNIATKDLRDCLPDMVSQQVNDLPFLTSNDPKLVEKIKAIAANPDRAVALHTPKKIQEDPWWKIF